MGGGSDTGTTGDGDGDGDGDGTGDGDGDDTSTLEDCYELSQDTCPDEWPLLVCDDAVPVCDTLVYDSDQALDGPQMMILDCILTALSQGTPGVYRVEDTFFDGPRSLYIHKLAAGNALIAKQETVNFEGCMYEEAVQSVPPASVIEEMCGSIELDTSAVETCVFGLGTGCGFYVGDPCGG